MSKALREVMMYANEDVAQIDKHWIILLRAARNSLIRVIVYLSIYWRFGYWIEYYAGKLNEWFPVIPFDVKKYIFPVLLMWLFCKTLVVIIKAFIVYNTVGLTVNNIQVKGKCGLVDVDVVNVPLGQVTGINAYVPFWGRIFHYGSICISTNGSDISMTDMKNVEKFQEAIVLLQEVQKEGRNIRTAERYAETIEKQTIAQVQALNGISGDVVKQIEVYNEVIESDMQTYIEQKK